MSSARRQQTQQERRAQLREADIVTMPVQTQAATNEREPQMPLERIGDILRRTRERRGDDLGAIADYLCIRRGFLDALENSRYDEFPADAYVIGFLRSYAELLGLDGKEAIDRYRAEMAGRRKKPSLILPTPITEGRAPSVFVLIGALIAALLVYVVWYSLSTSDRASVSIAPPLPSAPATATPTSDSSNTSTTASVPPGTIPVTTSAPMPSPTPGSITINAVAPAESIVPPTAPGAPVALTPAASAPTAQAPAKLEAETRTPAVAPPSEKTPTPIANKGTHVAIKAQQSSWVMVSDNHGNTLFDRVLKPGETYNVPDKPDLLLTTGNPAGITLTLDDVDLPKLSSHTSGIMRDISIDMTHLKALQPKD